MDINVLVKAHSGIAYLALLIYVVRGIMMLAGSAMTSARWMLGISSIITLALFGMGIFVAFQKQLNFAE